MKRVLILVLLVVVCGLGGCTGLYGRLPRVEDVPEYAELARRADALPWKMERVAVLPLQGKPLAMVVYDNEQMSAREVVVLIHGLTADNWSWRFVRGALTDYRVIAVDMPGCGQSDAPDLSEMGPEGYSPSGLARCILQALRTHLADHPAASFTLAGHSLGGTVVLRMFGDEALRTQYQDVLGRVKGVALYAPAHMKIFEMPASIKVAANVQDWQVMLAEGLGMVPDLAAGIIREGMEYEPCALREMADKEEEFLRDAPRRHAMKWMIESVVPSKDGTIDWAAAEDWVRQYQRVQVPCLLTWGNRDEILATSMGYEMQREIPHAKLCIVQNARHSLLLEQPGLCAQLLRDVVERRMGTEDVATVVAKAPAGTGVVRQERGADGGGGDVISRGN
jgi:pimeloyl-ACP methyl ester carboxylesterase